MEQAEAVMLAGTQNQPQLEDASGVSVGGDPPTAAVPGLAGDGFMAGMIELYGNGMMNATGAGGDDGAGIYLGGGSAGAVTAGSGEVGGMGS